MLNSFYRSRWLNGQASASGTGGRAIPKALKMVLVATLLGAQHYKVSTGFSSPNKYRTINIATLTKVKKESDNNQCLYSPEERMEDWQSC